MALRHFAAPIFALRTFSPKIGPVALAACLCLTAVPAFAAPGDSSAPTSPDSAATQPDQPRPHGEHLTVHGKRTIPPGYAEAPTGDITHGPDPDHLSQVHRDAVTGSDLSHFGSSYQGSSPYGDGQLGDSTGNGWVTPHGNGD
jgi:hypothetical protein